MRTINTTILASFMLCFTLGLYSQKNVKYELVKGYFVKNNVSSDVMKDYKIMDSSRMNRIFGMAAFMGKNGKPTTIDFKKKFVLFVLIDEMNINVNLKPLSL